MAATIGVPDVVLADNGYVSVGIPINGSVIGSTASRSTHPKFIWLFNRLLAEVLPGVRIRNPFASGSHRP